MSQQNTLTTNPDRTGQLTTNPDRSGTCPWCGKKNKPLYRTTALVPLKTGSEDVTVISEYVCASCLGNDKAERFWIKRLMKENFNG